MDHLWAPWRMAYINSGTNPGANAGASGESGPPGCIFCRKPAETEDEANLVLWRGERCFALMNLYPYNNGHLMIAPYAHVATIADLDAATLTDIMLTAQRCLAALDAALHPHGYNMGINQGAVAGAGIADHVHFHIVPRWNGDTNFMPVLADVKVMPDFLQNTYRQIREQLVAQAQARGETEPGAAHAHPSAAGSSATEPGGTESGETESGGTGPGGAQMEAPNRE